MDNTTQISTEQKINMIFLYLFDNKKSEEEEFFWNNLNIKEIEEVKNIRLEETNDFSFLKNQILGKSYLQLS